MPDTPTTLRLSLELALAPQAAFDVLVEELAAGLARAGIVFEPGPGGCVIEGEFEIGRVIRWTPGEQILLEWHPANWQPDETTEVELRLVARSQAEGGTRAVLELRGWGRLTGSPDELAGWFAGEVAAPFLRATAPAALGDWLTDRRARRPSGK